MSIMAQSLTNSAVDENENAVPHFLIGAIISVFWLSLGLSTFLNNLALYFINDNLEDRSVFPTTVGSLIWLVAGIWLSGYVAGLVIGIFTGREKRRSMIVSAIIGYEFMVVLRLIFLDAFPNIQKNAFEDVYHSFTMAGIPGHISFLFLTLIFGVGLVWLAVYTGYVIGQMSERIREIQFDLDPRIMISMLLLPAALLILFWSLTNLLDWETIEATNRNQFEPFILLHVDIFLNPALHMIMTTIVGLMIGLSPYTKGLGQVVLSTAIGGMCYVLLVMLTKDLLMLYAPLEYEDALNFGYPNLILFSLLWIGTVFTAMASAFAFYNIRIIIFGGGGDDSNQPNYVIQSEAMPAEVEQIWQPQQD